MTRLTLFLVALALALALACGGCSAGEQLASKDFVTMRAIQRVERKLDSLRVEVRAMRAEGE